DDGGAGSRELGGGHETQPAVRSGDHRNPAGLRRDVGRAPTSHGGHACMRCMADYDEIRYDVDDHVLTLTLHRPDKLNAFTPVMCRELIDAFTAANADDAVRAVIVTGAGRAFCAGADLSGGGETFDNTAQGRTDTLDAHRDGG